MKMKIVCAIAVMAGAAGLLAAAERAAPCCAVKSIDARTRMVTVVENKTACTYEFQAKTAADLVGLKVGSAITLDVKALVDLAEPAGRRAGLAKKPAEPVNKPAEPAGKPAEPINDRPTRGVAATASAASSTACGSNVPRNAKTKTLCKRMTGPNSWEYVTCP
jgi:hypothetical protein